MDIQIEPGASNDMSLCTSEKQRELMTMGGSTQASLKSLFLNPEYAILFEENELPRVHMLGEDGNIFIIPAKYVSKSIPQYHIWVAIAPDKASVVHGFSYPYVELRPDYWLVKMIIPVASLKSELPEMSVEYFQPVSQISVIRNIVYNPDHTEAESIGIKPYDGDPVLPFADKTPAAISKEIIIPILKAIGVDMSDIND